MTTDSLSIAARTALIERAKGALMLRFGVDSYQALAVLLHWAQVTRTPLHTVAEMLMHGICEGNRETEERQRPLKWWLSSQLRDGDPDLPQLPATPVWSRAGN